MLRQCFLLFFLAAIVILPIKANSAFNPQRGGVVICHDDGDRSSCQILFDLSNTHQIKISYGIVVQRVLDGYEGIITQQQIQDRSKSPYAKFVSHTMTHPYLTTVSDTDLDWELGESKRILEEWTQIPVTTIFDPYGDYDSRVLQHSKKFYRFGRRAWPSDANWDFPYNHKPYPLMELEAIGVKNGDTPESILAKIQEAKSRGEVPIILFHLVIDGSTVGLNEYNYPKVDLEKIFQGINALGIRSLTFEEAFSSDISAAINLLLLGE